MRNIFIIALLMFVSNAIFAQDLIVTNQGDSINCKITKVKTDYIYFTFKHKEEIRSTLLPVADVKVHQFNYFQTAEVPKDKIVNFENYQHFRAAIQGGYSYFSGDADESLPEDFQDYEKELKSGYHFAGDLTYFFTESLGVGIKGCLAKTSNSMDNIYVEDIYGNIKYGILTDDINVSFIGPTFSTRYFNKSKRNAFLINMSIGYMGYSNDKIIVENYKLTGSTVGFSLDLGYDIGFSENLSLGFQVSALGGSLQEYDVSDGVTTETYQLEEGEDLGLGHFDFSIGLRFGK